MNGFMVFSNKYRDEVRAENPGASMTKIAQILGKEWRELPEKNKEKYKRLAAKGSSGTRRKRSA